MSTKKLDHDSIFSEHDLAHELVVTIALQVQQRCQIAMVDLHVGFCCDNRLGMERNTEAGVLDHDQIVRAIANGKRLRCG